MPGNHRLSSDVMEQIAECVKNELRNEPNSKKKDQR